MADMLFNLIFKVLNFVASLFISPINALVTALVPSFPNYMLQIRLFFNTAFQFIGFVVNLLMIPKGLIVGVMAFGLTIFTFNLSLRVIGLGMAIYHYFKP